MYVCTSYVATYTTCMHVLWLQYITSITSTNQIEASPNKNLIVLVEDSIGHFPFWKQFGDSLNEAHSV